MRAYIYLPHLRRPAEAVLEGAPPVAPHVPVPVPAAPRGPAQLLRPVAAGEPGRLGRGRRRRHGEERQQQQRRRSRAARHGSS